MKILAIVPARSGSKGIKNKNIIDVCSKPLLAYSIEHGLALKSLDLVEEVIVSTDSTDYLKTLKPLGYKNDYLRPSALAGDNSPTIDAAIHALEHYAKKNIYFDNIMILQPTSPFRNVSQIKEAIDLISSKRDL